jgi:hypothetical protein
MRDEKYSCNSETLRTLQSLCTSTDAAVALVTVPVRAWHPCCVRAKVGGSPMPEKATVARARRDKRAGKAPSTQAGEFVREEIHHVREGKHGARSTKQAIAIGLSKARRAGVKLPSPPASAKASTKRSAASASRAANRRGKTSSRRARATRRALKREGRRAASRKALLRQAKAAARRRPASARRAAAQKAARTRRRRTTV